MAGIYLHIPFCKQACNYCDFHFTTRQTNRKVVVEAICLELEIQSKYLENEIIETIYLGGGTPSLLLANELELIFNTLDRWYDLQSSEITIEANPDDLTRNKLSSLKSIGINRLSIGIQSFHDSELKWMNRSHDSKQAIHAFEDARNAGFDNISIDLIYGVPGRTLDDWRINLDLALDLKPQHLSCYSLTVEPGTRLNQMVKKGEALIADEELLREFYLVTDSILTKGNYEHYEISNYSIPTKEAIHNSNYWSGVSYLGVGPSAHSYVGNKRMINVSNNLKYLNSISKGIVPNEIETIDHVSLINERLMTGLRTGLGFDLNFPTSLGVDFKNLRKLEINNLLDLNLGILEDDHLKLTLEGQLIADSITTDLFLE